MRAGIGSANSGPKDLSARAAGVACVVPPTAADENRQIDSGLFMPPLPTLPFDRVYLMHTPIKYIDSGIMWTSAGGTGHAVNA